MEEFRCSSCHQLKPRLAHVPNQQFCGSRECQRERKRRWQAQKLAEDPDYAANQEACSRAWREAHPDYWCRYRREHLKAVEQNRELQRVRNAARRNRAKGSPALAPPASDASTVIAKMDAFQEEVFPVLSGRYRLIPEDAAGIAKMDASLIVQLAVLSTVSTVSPVSTPSHEARPP